MATVTPPPPTWGQNNPKYQRCHLELMTSFDAGVQHWLGDGVAALSDLPLWGKWIWRALRVVQSAAKEGEEFMSGHGRNDQLGIDLMNLIDTLFESAATKQTLDMLASGRGFLIDWMTLKALNNWAVDDDRRQTFIIISWTWGHFSLIDRSIWFDDLK